MADELDAHARWGRAVNARAPRRRGRREHEQRALRAVAQLLGGAATPSTDPPAGQVRAQDEEVDRSCVSRELLGCVTRRRAGVDVAELGVAVGDDVTPTGDDRG